MNAPLSGIRVLDLSRVLAGPYCTAMLADLGAEVIKIEAPGGDDARHLGPFQGEASAYFAQLNRGKRSVVLNLRDPAAVAALHELAETADVVVENFRPGVAARLGVGFEALHRRNPRLVYLSISGYGQDGPNAALPAYDLAIQAESGIMSITGFPEGPPTRVGESLGDLWAGMHGAWAIMTALFDRERTGRGRHLDVAMFDALLAMQVTAFSQLRASGRTPQRVGNRHPISTPFDTYRTRDGLMVIAVANERLFAAVCDLIGRPDLVADPRFADDTSRTLNEADIRTAIEEWSMALSTEEAVALATRRGIPTGRVATVAEAVGSAQAQHRDLIAEVDEPGIGPTRVLRQPVRFSDWSMSDPAPSPVLGADTESVLGELLGYDDARIRALLSSPAPLP